MFGLHALRKEISRSHKIAQTANETSKEVRDLYKQLDKKYDLKREKTKLERIPHIRKRIVQNFIKDLRETEQHLEDDTYNGRHKKNTIQKFLNKIAPINDNQVTS